MDENISIKEIMEAASGADENGYAKAAVGLFSEMVDSEGNVVEAVQDVSCKKPIVKIHRSFNRVFVDLVFQTHIDVDLSVMNSLLNDAFSPERSVGDDADKFSLVTLSIVPEKYDGYYYMIGTDPMFWALTGETPKSEMNTIRFVFDEDDFFVMEASQEEIDQIRIDVDAELEAEQRERDFYETKASEGRRYH